MLSTNCCSLLTTGCYDIENHLFYCNKSPQLNSVQCFTVYQELGLVITGTLPVFNKTKTKDDRNVEVR